MKEKSFWLLVLIFLLLAACGASKTYLVDIRYVPQSPPSPKVKQGVVGMAPFVDRRSRKNDVAIRNKLDGSVDRYTTAPASVSERIKKAVEKFLRHYDFKFVEIQEWDLKVENLSKVDTDLVVGGEIKRFWSRADSLAGRTIITTEVELAIYLGKPREGKVLQQTIEMSSEITEIIFSQQTVEEALNELLSEIIEEAFAKLLVGAKMQNPVFMCASTDYS